jgi:putative CRISPR-associated protein (TIGR02619 family)
MMKEGTPSHKIAKYLVGDANSVIIFPGYLDPKSEGYKLLNNKVYEINNETFDVKCKVDKVQFSAHASKKDLENLLLEIKPQSSIYIHGDKSAVDNMQKFSEKNNIVSSAPLFNGEETIVVQNNSDIKLIQTGKTNAVIILVGTSVITNYQREKNCKDYTEEELLQFLYEKDSAETNTIKKLLKDKKISKNNVFYFIATDTDKGKTASTVLMQYLKDNFDVNYAEIKFIRHLTDNADEIQSKGITNFIDVVTNIISEHNDACIIATGGYKVEMSFATLIGLIYSKKVLYIHEDFNTIIETPIIPFVPDFSEYMIYKEDIEKLLKASPSKENNNKYKSLPKTIKDLLIQEKKTGIFKLSAMGKIISNFSFHIKNKENNIIIDKNNIIENLWNIDNENKNLTLDNMKNVDFAKKNKNNITKSLCKTH